MRHGLQGYRRSVAMPRMGTVETRNVPSGCRIGIAVAWSCPALHTRHIGICVVRAQESGNPVDEG
ncbi:MAG: hypothetical protein KTU85_09285, partial [Acidimicrobiia bacterium]|nr:hypothetical protein [Acidimicrobiia bacterium]